MKLTPEELTLLEMAKEHRQKAIEHQRKVQRYMQLASQENTLANELQAKVHNAMIARWEVSRPKQPKAPSKPSRRERIKGDHGRLTADAVDKLNALLEGLSDEHNRP